MTHQYRITVTLGRAAELHAYADTRLEAESKRAELQTRYPGKRVVVREPER